MKRNKPKTSLQLSKSGGSPVARASLGRSGAGKHGGSVRQQNRRARKAAKQELRFER